MYQSFVFIRTLGDLVNIVVLIALESGIEDELFRNFVIIYGVIKIIETALLMVHFQLQ